jgi:hypothetical protein
MTWSVAAAGRALEFWTEFNIQVCPLVRFVNQSSRETINAPPLIVPGGAVLTSSVYNTV